MKQLIFITFLALTLAASPSYNPKGVYFGPAKPAAVIEIFYDLMCSDSKRSFADFSATYSTTSTIGVRIVNFPLIMHSNSWKFGNLWFHF